MMVAARRKEACRWLTRHRVRAAAAASTTVVAVLCVQLRVSNPPLPAALAAIRLDLRSPFPPPRCPPQVGNFDRPNTISNIAATHRTHPCLVARSHFVPRLLCALAAYVVPGERRAVLVEGRHDQHTLLRLARA